MSNWLGGYRVIKNHTRTTSSSSAATDAFDASIEYVRVTTTGPVFIEFAAAPTIPGATAPGITAMANNIAADSITG